MTSAVDWGAVEPDSDDDVLAGLSPISARIFDRLAFIMATAEEVSVIVDSPGVPEDSVRQVTDVLVSVYAQADHLMRRLSH
jgi:hypothetical protein